MNYDNTFNFNISLFIIRNWGILYNLHELRQLCYTVGDVLDIMMDSPFFMPIVNTLFLIIWGIMYVVTSLKIHLPFVKFWSKIKNIKIK